MLHLSLDYFNLPPERKYHIYRINNSKSAEVPHSHSYFQICYVDRGEIEHWSDEGPVQLCFGDAFIVPPNFTHRLVFTNSNAYIYSLAFGEDVFSQGFVYSNAHHFLTMLKLDTIGEKHLDTRMRISLDDQQRVIMKHLFEALRRFSDCDRMEEFSAARSMICSILYILAQAYFADERHEENYTNLIETNEAMTKCIEYIDNHFTEPLSLGELSKRFAFSKTSFGILFPRYTGVTLKQYISEKRIDNAVILIRNTDMTINSIAKLIGYDDFSTFYRNFVSFTGLSPSQYKAKWRRDDSAGKS